MSWKVSPLLVPLIREVQNKHPGMVIETIGDTAHQEEQSDHNPDQWGYVCAGDFMISPKFTIADAQFLFTRLRQINDMRLAYSIYDRRIVSSTVDPWKPRIYNGKDPHTGHVHVSVRHSPTPRPTTSWHIYNDTPKEVPPMPIDWDSPTVQAINFFYAEAYRASQDKATTPYPATGTPTAQARADRAARNAYVFTSHSDGVDPE
jgi:hypothetical protein